MKGRWRTLAVGFAVIAATLVTGSRAQANPASLTDGDDTTSKLDVHSGSVSDTPSTITYNFTMDSFAPSDVAKIFMEFDFNADSVADTCMRITPSSAPGGFDGRLFTDGCNGSFGTGGADAVSIVSGNTLQVLLNNQTLRDAGLGGGKQYGLRVLTLDFPSKDFLPPFVNDTAPDSGFVTHKLNKIVCGSQVSGNVTLTEDITGCAGDGLSIKKDDTVLNLNGHKIESNRVGFPPYPGTTGVKVGAFKHVTISGGTISAFDTGIAFNNSANTSSLPSLVKSVTISGNTNGIDIVGGTYVTVKKATVTGSRGVGIQVTGSNHTLVKNTVTGSATDGIRSPSGKKITFTNNTASTNGGQPPTLPASADGIDVDSTKAVLNGNVADTNDGDGINVPADATGSGNTATGNLVTNCTGGTPAVC